MESDSESFGSVKSAGSSNKLALFKNTANKLSAIAGVAKTLKQIEETNCDVNEESGYRYGNASPLFTPRTFKEIQEKIVMPKNIEGSRNLKTTKTKKTTKFSRNEIKLVLVKKFNSLRHALGVIPISHGLQTNDMVTVLKLSDLLIDFGEQLDAHYLPYLRYGVLLKEWLIMNRSVYSKVTQANNGAMHSMLNLKSFYSHGGDKSTNSAISTVESMRLAKGHLQLWLRQGLFADDQHLQRSRELYEMSKASLHHPTMRLSSKPMMSIGGLSFNGLSSPSKQDAANAVNGSDEMTPEDWLRYLRVLEYQGDHVAAAELVRRLLTLLDPSQEQAQSSEPFSAQEAKAKGDRFANLLFYAGCIHKALGMFERANEYFFEAIEFGPPKPLNKIEMMMIISRNLEEMHNANENGGRQGDIVDTPNEDAYRMIHEHLILECLLDESVSYDDWVSNSATWFALGDKCSLHHMYSLANDLYGIGLMMDPLAYQKPMVWFRFVKSCLRCGRVTDAQLAMKQALRRDEHNPQLLRADKHLSQKVSVPRPTAASHSDGTVDNEKLLANWREGADYSLFQLAHAGNFAAIQSLLPAELDVTDDSTRRLQAIVRGIFERFNLRMGVGPHRLLSSAEASISSSHDATKKRIAVKKMMAKAAVVLAIQEADVDVFEGEPEHHVNYFPFLLSVRPNWMGMISHIDAYDVRSDKKIRIKLQQSFSPIHEAGVPRRLQLSLEVKKLLTSDLTRENIRATVPTIHLLPEGNTAKLSIDNNNNNIFASGKISARTEVVLKYTDILTGEYIYRSMQLKFSFDHHRNSIELTNPRDCSAEVPDLSKRLSLALDDLSLGQNYQVDCSNEEALNMRSEMDTSSVMADVHSVAHWTDISSVLSESVTSKGKEENVFIQNIRHEEPAAVTMEILKTHEMVHSTVSISTPSVYESLSVTQVDEDADHSSAVILTNIQRAMIFKGSITWRKSYFFVTIANENDVTLMKLTEMNSLFSFVFLFRREHFDRSQKLLKCVKMVMKYVEKNELISAILSHMSDEDIVNTKSTSKVAKKVFETENFTNLVREGSRCYYTYFSPAQLSLLVAFYSPNNNPMLGVRLEIFDSSGHYLRGNNSLNGKIKAPMSKQPRILLSTRFRNIVLDEFMTNGSVSAKDDASLQASTHLDILATSAENSISLHSSQRNDSMEDLAIDRAKESATLPVLSEKKQPNLKHHHLHHKSSIAAVNLASPKLSHPPVPVALQVYHHRKDSKLHRRSLSVSTAGSKSDAAERSIEIASDSFQADVVKEKRSSIEVTPISSSHNSVMSHSVKFDVHIDNATTSSFDSDMKNLRLGGQIEDDSIAGSNFEVTVDPTNLHASNMRATLSSAVFYDLPLHIPIAELGASIVSDDAPETPISRRLTGRSQTVSFINNELLQSIAQDVVNHIVEKAIEIRLLDHSHETHSECADVSQKEECTNEFPSQCIEAEISQLSAHESVQDPIKERRRSLDQVTGTEKHVEYIVCNILEAMLLATEYLSHVFERNQSLIQSVSPIIPSKGSITPPHESTDVDEDYNPPQMSVTVSSSSSFVDDASTSDLEVDVAVAVVEQLESDSDENTAIIIFEELLSSELQLISIEVIEASATTQLNKSIVHSMSVEYVEQLLARITEIKLPFHEMIEPEPAEEVLVDDLNIVNENSDPIVTMMVNPISMVLFHGLETSSTFRTNLDPIAESDNRSVTSMQSSLSSGMSAIERPFSGSLDDVDCTVSKSIKIADELSSIHSTVTLPQAIAALDDSSNVENTGFEIIQQTSYLPISTTPYKVTKLLSAGRRRMEAKEFLPPQNVWTTGTGTGKGTHNRAVPLSTYSFESANRLLQNLRDISHQLALRKAKIKESNDKIIAGRVARRDDGSPLRPTTAPAEGRTSPFQPGTPFRFGKDPISSFIAKVDALSGKNKPKSAGVNRTHSSSFDSVVNEDSDFRYLIESRPSTPERKLVASVASPSFAPKSPSNSLSWLDSSSVQIGEAGMMSQNPSQVQTTSKIANQSFTDRSTLKKSGVVNDPFSKVRAQPSIAKKHIQGSLLHSISSDSGLNTSKDVLLRQTIRGFSKVGYVEDKPLLFTTFWTESLTRYLQSVGSVSALQKKLMAVHRLSPVRFSLTESICALAETDGNVGEIRIKARELKFHSDVQLISSILPVKDIVSTILVGGEDLFNGVINPLKATSHTIREVEPSSAQETSPLLLPDDSFHSAGRLSSVSNNSIHSDDEEDFLAPLSSYEQSDIANKVASSSTTTDDNHNNLHPKRKTQMVLPGLAPAVVEKPRFRNSVSGIQLRQESLAVRKRASVVTFYKPSAPSISPLASLYFQKQQTNAVKVKSSDGNLRLQLPKDASLSLTRSSSRHDDMSRTSESTDLYPDFDGGLQTSLGDYIDNLADAYKLEEKEWVPLVKTEFVENTFKVLSNDVVATPIPIQKAPTQPQPQPPLQVLIHHHPQPQHQPHQVHHLQRTNTSSLILQTPIQPPSKKSVRITNTITTMFENQDSQSIAVLCRRDALRAQQEDNLMKSDRFGPQPAAAGRRKGTNIDLSALQNTNLKVALGKVAAMRNKLNNSEVDT